MRGARVQALMEVGTESITDLPDDERLSELQRRVREAVRSGRPHVGADLGAEFDGMAPPAHFIDFETIAPALPVYPGTRPFEVRPFHWSDDVLYEDGSVRHAEFLAAGDEDPMRGFAESLVEQLAGGATVVVYSGYEEVRLRELAEALPELRRRLNRVLAIPRVDLLRVLRSHYYHPEFRGSFSLKSVLPVLVPNSAMTTWPSATGRSHRSCSSRWRGTRRRPGAVSNSARICSRIAGATRKRWCGSSRPCGRRSSLADSLRWKGASSGLVQRLGEPPRLLRVSRCCQRVPFESTSPRRLTWTRIDSAPSAMLTSSTKGSWLPRVASSFVPTMMASAVGGHHSLRSG